MLTPAELSQLAQVGISEDEAKAANERILALKELPPIKSARGLLLDKADLYRQSAVAAEEMGKAPGNQGEPGYLGPLYSQTFVVGNPHDKQETVDLYIRPVSVPAGWYPLVWQVRDGAQGQSTPPTIDPSAPVLRIKESGKHYSVTLPPRGTIRVASVLAPVGEMGANTNARWAVEGKIGDELIGGMMHEMIVPSLVPDLQLPPVGSTPQPAAPASGLPAQPASPSEVNWLLYAGAAALALLVLGAVATLVLRRRKV
jgi:hypothetical protein